MRSAVSRSENRPRRSMWDRSGACRMRYADCHGESAGRSGDIGHKRRGGSCRYAVPDIFPCTAYTYRGIPADICHSGRALHNGTAVSFCKEERKTPPNIFSVGRHRSCVPIFFFYADHGREHGQQQLSARGKMAGRKYLGNELASGSCPVALYAHIMTTKPLAKSTSCCGSRSCESSETGQSREKHGGHRAFLCFER